MGKSAPEQPDPIKTAQAQSTANVDAVRESAKVNAVDQFTPYGSVTYTKDADGVPTAQNVALTPLQQEALDQKNQLATVLGGQALNQSANLPQDKYSLDGFGQVNSDYTNEGNNVRDAYFGQQMGMLQPQFDQENRAMEQNIANRGLPINGEGAQTLEDNLYRRQSDARNQISNNAILTGGNEQNRLLGNELQVRNQGINEYNAERQQPFNEMSAYLQGQPIFQAPSATQAQYQIAPADVSGNIYKNYSAQNANYQNNLNGMYSTAGTAAMAAATFSDRRLKRFIEPIGRMEETGLTVYRYKYVWGGKWQVGVMADEVKEVVPDAVVRHWTGYDMVDYGRIK